MKRFGFVYENGWRDGCGVLLLAVAVGRDSEAWTVGIGLLGFHFAFHVFRKQP